MGGWAFLMCLPALCKLLPAHPLGPCRRPPLAPRRVRRHRAAVTLCSLLYADSVPLLRTPERAAQALALGEPPACSLRPAMGAARPPPLAVSPTPCAWLCRMRV